MYQSGKYVSADVSQTVVRLKTLLFFSAKDECAESTGGPNSSSPKSVLSWIVKKILVLFSVGWPKSPLTLTAKHF